LPGSVDELAEVADIEAGEDTAGKDQ
jgi:hypothetical protein